MTAISPNLISWTALLPVWYLHGCIIVAKSRITILCRIVYPYCIDHAGQHSLSLPAYHKSFPALITASFSYKFWWPIIFILWVPWLSNEKYSLWLVISYHQIQWVPEKQNCKSITLLYMVTGLNKQMNSILIYDTKQDKMRHLIWVCSVCVPMSQIFLMWNSRNCNYSIFIQCFWSGIDKQKKSA